MNGLSIEAQLWLLALGNFGPTINTADCLMKGYMIDPETGEGARTYFNNEDFRSMAHAANKVADWLEARCRE